MFSVFLLSYCYRNTCESLGELIEKAVETLAFDSCSHSISQSCSPKRPLVFLQLDRNIAHVFYFLVIGAV